MSASDEQYKKKLIERYVAGEASEKELQAFFGLLTESEIDSIIEAHMDQEILGLREEQRLLTPVKRFKIWKYAAVVSGVLLLSYGSYHIFHKNQVPKTEFANDIAPGTNKPVLTLAGGQKIVLANNQGTIAKQGAVIIRQNAAGQIIYTASNTGTTEASFNTLTNPRGSKVISLILPDGTLAKLDAASSITYRTVFSGKTRDVATTGRVYFAVTYHKEQPFFSTTKGQTVRDLGTHFIVDAYDDEPSIKTTLIEGSVEVGKDGKKTKLIPGQQSIIQSTNNSITVKQVDLDEETAWVNGDFDFHNQDLGNIMRQLARVYNIDVTYKGDVEHLRFGGMISRSRNISAVLNLMESTGKIHFEINGRRVMVIAGQK